MGLLFLIGVGQLQRHRGACFLLQPIQHSHIFQTHRIECRCHC